MHRLQKLYSRLWLTVIVGLLALGGGFVMAQARTAHASEEVSTQSEPNIPQIFNYQGYLRNTDGSLMNATVKITAKIYDLPTGGSVLYPEVFDNVVVRDGLFTIVLGDNGSQLNHSLDGAPRYIGISVNSDPELTPRERVHAVPWSIHATNAAHANSADSATNADSANAAFSFPGVSRSLFLTDNLNGSTSTSGSLVANNNFSASSCFLVAVKTTSGATASCEIDPTVDPITLTTGAHNYCEVTCIHWYGN